MVDRETILERIKTLEKYLDELKKYQNLSQEQLKSDLGELWKVEHGLQLAIECILDIGNHVITEERLGTPQSYHEIVELLGEKRVIPAELANEMAGIAGFRNILIHEYLKVDAQKVHENLQKGPAQFERFIRAILEHLR
jgi:uncharacterized protein YutE (UPF0331/DUF86 family)